MLRVVGVFIALFVGIVLGSSHSEAPGSYKRPQIDATDLFAFRSYEPGRENFVTFLVNYNPLQDSYAGPNYFALSDNAVYEIYIDSDGDVVEDLTFQFMFGFRLANRRGATLKVGGRDIPIPLKFTGPIVAGNDSALNFFEYYHLNVIQGTRTTGTTKSISNAADGSTEFKRPFDYAGTKTFPDYEAYVDQYKYSINIPDCATPGRVFVGQRQEPFAVNLGKIFDLVNFVPIDGTAVPGGITQDPANNKLSNKAITTLALEVPIQCLVGSGNGVIGVWSGVRALKHGRRGEHLVTRQLNRLGMPLINEVVIGLPDKDRFNKSPPKDDPQFLDYVQYPTLPAIIDLLFRQLVNTALGASFTNIAPTVPRNDLVGVALFGIPNFNQLQINNVPGEMLRLNTGINPTLRASQSNLGVFGNDNAGFPNGRRPGDDTIDIMLRVVMGAVCHLPSEIQTYCTPADAPVGFAPLTDGAPVSALDFDDSFPYLRTPLPGSA